MPKAIKPFVLALVIVTAQFASGQTRGQENMATKRVAVAILGIDMSGVGLLPEETGVLLSELVAIELARADSVDVLERQRVDDLLEESALRLSGQTGDGHGRELVRMLGARFLVRGMAFAYKDKLTISVNLTETETGFVQGVIYEGSIEERISEVASSLGEQILNALAIEMMTDHPVKSPPSTTQPDSRITLDVDGHCRVRVQLVVTETFLKKPSERFLVQNQLGLLLLERGFEVVSPTDRSVGWSTIAAEFSEEVLSGRLRDHLKDIDMVILGQASAVPSLRTGDLISARAQLDLRLYSVRTGKRVQTLQINATALGTSVELATGEALRRAAGNSLEVILPFLQVEVP